MRWLVAVLLLTIATRAYAQQQNNEQNQTVTVANLPSCNAALLASGKLHWSVSDSLYACGTGGLLVGGGTTTCPVICLGSIWFNQSSANGPPVVTCQQLNTISPASVQEGQELYCRDCDSPIILGAAATYTCVGDHAGTIVRGGAPTTNPVWLAVP